MEHKTHPSLLFTFSQLELTWLDRSKLVIGRFSVVLMFFKGCLFNVYFCTYLFLFKFTLSLCPLWMPPFLLFVFVNVFVCCRLRYIYPHRGVIKVYPSIETQKGKFSSDKNRQFDKVWQKPITVFSSWSILCPFPMLSCLYPLFLTDTTVTHSTRSIFPYMSVSFRSLLTWCMLIPFVQSCCPSSYALSPEDHTADVIGCSIVGLWSSSCIAGFLGRIPSTVASTWGQSSFR